MSNNMFSKVLGEHYNKQNSAIKQVPPPEIKNYDF